MGKTSTKEAIATVLLQKFKVLKSEGNLNTKLGLAVEVVNKLRKSHQKLVVEVGMDRIGEIKVTCQLIKPRIGTVTFINPTHQEKLKTLENIKEPLSLNVLLLKLKKSRILIHYIKFLNMMILI